MEENMEIPTTKSIGMKWGLILGVISVVFFLGIALTGSQGDGWANWVGVIPTIAILILAHKEFKESGDGYMSYGKGIGIGTLTVAINSVISTLFSYVYIKFVDDTYFDIVREKQIEGFQEQGMSDREIETALSFSEGFMSPETVLIMGIIVGIFFGFIISLIVTAFTKNSNPELDV